MSIIQVSLGTPDGYRDCYILGTNSSAIQANCTHEIEDSRRWQNDKQIARYCALRVQRQVSPNEVRQSGPVYTSSQKPKVRPLIPNVLTPFLSLNLTFQMMSWPEEDNLRTVTWKRKDSIYFWPQRQFYSKGRYLVKSRGRAHNEGIWHEGWQMNRRRLFWGTMGFGPPILLSGYPVVRSQPVSQASSGYQAVCCSVA